MKIAPIAQGQVTSAMTTTGTSVIPDAKARAIAAMTGQEAPKQTPGQEVSPQVERALKTIKMKTQMSTNRHEFEPAQEPGVELAPEATAPATEAVPGVELAPPASSDNVENAQPVAENVPLSPQVAALARAKRAFQQEKAAFEKAKAEFEASKGQPDQLADYISKADLKTKPLSVLVDNGITYDQLTEAILNGQGPNPDILALKQELAAVRKELTEQLSERDKLQEQQVLSQMRRDVDSVVNGSDKYKATQAAKAQSQVVELIHRTWQQQGEILDIETAADLVEKQIRDEAMPFVDLLRPQPQPEPQVQAPPQPVVSQQSNVKVMRTLTNRDTAAPGPNNRRARAIAAFYGQNKG